LAEEERFKNQILKFIIANHSKVERLRIRVEKGSRSSKAYNTLSNDEAIIN